MSVGEQRDDRAGLEPMIESRRLYPDSSWRCPVSPAGASGSPSLHAEMAKALSQRKRKEFRDVLRDIAALLPLPAPAGSRCLSQKEILLHLLRYLQLLRRHIDDAQSKLPETCVLERGFCSHEEDPPPEPLAEPRTPPRCLKAKRKSVCGRPRKRPAPDRELCEDVPEKRRRLYGAQSDLRDGHPNTRLGSLALWDERPEWPAFQSGTIQAQDRTAQDSSSSLDSELSLSLPSWRTAPSAETPGGQEPRTPGDSSWCSACGERTGSEEDGSCRVLDVLQPEAWGLLAKDHLLGGYPSSEDGEFPLTPGSAAGQAPAPTPSTPGSQLGALDVLDDLNLSPSLFTSPARDVPASLLHKGHEELEALFEDVWISSEPPMRTGDPSRDSVRPPGLGGRGSLFPGQEHRAGGRLGLEPWTVSRVRAADVTPWTPDRGSSRKPSPSCCRVIPGLLPGPVSQVQDSGEATGAGGWLSSQSEEEEEGADLTWTPSQRGPAQGGRGGRGQHRHRGAPGELRHLKRKCVNGFIMFCRLNRKSYMRAHPGTPSTVATKELARMWHGMAKAERRLYCRKAQKFSCQQNRNVRSQWGEEEEEEDREET
ncbi:meiosis initiator protein isoform X2 [Lepisosteus oculatus]|uniref:meiosis initiator protein isoform X2 n=1 Tax=Lepisosteus oculatus TaxID=7918 RepID=UPI00371422C5